MIHLNEWRKLKYIVIRYMVIETLCYFFLASALLWRLSYRNFCKLLSVPLYSHTTHKTWSVNKNIILINWITPYDTILKLLCNTCKSKVFCDWFFVKYLEEEVTIIWEWVQHIRKHGTCHNFTRYFKEMVRMDLNLAFSQKNFEGQARVSFRLLFPKNMWIIFREYENRHEK